MPTAKYLRRKFSVPKAVFDSAVELELLEDTSYEVTDDIKFAFDVLASVKRIPTNIVANMFGVTTATMLKTAKDFAVKPTHIREFRLMEGGTGYSYEWAGEELIKLARARSEARTKNTIVVPLIEAGSEIARIKEQKQAEKERVKEQREERARMVEELREIDRVRIVGLNAAINPSARQGGDRSESVVTFHLGPTNSGKTYHAVQRILERFKDNPDGLYVYAGPLRMLAHEVMGTLSEIVGEENVGVLTGEESVNPTARILCCTAEMAPRSGDLLVIDEAHWAEDDSRGRHWTELLTTANFKETVVLGPSECEDVLKEVYADFYQDNVHVHHHRRKTPLEYIGKVTHGTLKPRTAVVAFSRRKVGEIVNFLHSRGIRALPLYGALPLDVRRAHISKFINGDVDIIVTTDVIGHGINLPIDHVVFVDTMKFDGRFRRPLKLWEAAQIAGRAGRFGLSDKGTVGWWGFQGGGKYGDPSIIAGLLEDAVEVASGVRESELSKLRLKIKPTLSALKIADDEHRYLGAAIAIWYKKAYKKYETSTLVTPSAMRESMENLYHLSFRLGCGLADDKYMYESRSLTGDFTALGWRIKLTDLWSLINGPFDHRDLALSAGAKWFEDGSEDDLHEAWLHAKSYSTEWSHKETLESRARQVSAFKSLAYMIGKDGGLPCGVTKEDMDAAASGIAESLSGIFDKELRHADRPRNKKRRRY